MYFPLLSGVCLQGPAPGIDQFAVLNHILCSQKHLINYLPAYSKPFG
jgi:hypothetical protein